MGSEARLVSEQNLREVAAWCGGIIKTEIDPFDSAVTNLAFNFEAISGVERAHVGDTVIKNHNGTFQLWKAE